MTCSVQKSKGSLCLPCYRGPIHRQLAKPDRSIYATINTQYKSKHHKVIGNPMGWLKQSYRFKNNSKGRQYPYRVQAISVQSAGNIRTYRVQRSVQSAGNIRIEYRDISIKSTGYIYVEIVQSSVQSTYRLFPYMYRQYHIYSSTGCIRIEYRQYLYIVQAIRIEYSQNLYSVQAISVQSTGYFHIEYRKYLYRIQVIYVYSTIASIFVQSTGNNHLEYRQYPYRVQAISVQIVQLHLKFKSNRFTINEPFTVQYIVVVVNLTVPDTLCGFFFSAFSFSFLFSVTPKKKNSLSYSQLQNYKEKSLSVSGLKLSVNTSWQTDDSTKES